MCRPPITRQPGPSRKPGAFSWKAMTELVIRLQERPAMSHNAIPGGLVLKSLKMAVGILFIHRWPSLQSAFPVVAGVPQVSGRHGAGASESESERALDATSVYRISNQGKQCRSYVGTEIESIWPAHGFSQFLGEGLTLTNSMFVARYRRGTLPVI